MRISNILLLVLLASAIAADPAKEKAVRLKTTRQLKEILTELKIKVPKDADKEDLRELALKHDAISKWEELHPEKKKGPPRGGGPMPGGGGMGAGNMADMMWPMMDKDGNGKLTLEEFAAMGGNEAEMTFKQMDSNGDGSVSRAEANTFFEYVSQTMGGMGGPGGGGMGGPGGGGMGGPGGGMEPQADYDSDVADEDEGDELPGHDEL